MKWSDFLLGALAGAVVAHLISRRKMPKNNPQMTEFEARVSAASNVLAEEGSKFSDVLKKQYDIVMPSDQIAQKVELKAQQLTQGRFSQDLSRIKDPFSL